MTNCRRKYWLWTQKVKRRRNNWQGAFTNTYRNRERTLFCSLSHRRSTSEIEWECPSTICWLTWISNNQIYRHHILVFNWPQGYKLATIYQQELPSTGGIYDSKLHGWHVRFYHRNVFGYHGNNIGIDWHATCRVVITRNEKNFLPRQIRDLHLNVIVNERLLGHNWNRKQRTILTCLFQRF